jgi:hypothetical protein
MVINQQALTWGGQIANQFKVALYARPLSAPEPPKAPCASGISIPGQPKQCVWADIWNAMYQINEPNPAGAQMSLASNSTFIAPWLPADNSTQQLVLTCNPTNDEPTVHVLDADGNSPDGNISVEVTDIAPVLYAVPGDSLPGHYMAITLSVTVAPGTQPGLRGVHVTIDDKEAGVLLAAVYIKG